MTNRRPTQRGTRARSSSRPRSASRSSSSSGGQRRSA